MEQRMVRLYMFDKSNQVNDIDCLTYLYIEIAKNKKKHPENRLIELEYCPKGERIVTQHRLNS